MFARNLIKPRAADPALARKSLAFLGILYLLGDAGFGNEPGLHFSQKDHSGRLPQLLLLRLGFLQDGVAVETRQSRRATGAPRCGGSVGVQVGSDTSYRARCGGGA